MTTDIFNSALVKLHHYEEQLSVVSPTPLKTASRLKSGRLSNGLEYKILPHNYPPHRISLHLVVHAGSLHENDDQQGIAHFLEHCVFLGTDKFQGMEDIRTELGALGMSYGPDLNAHTSFANTAFTLNCPSPTPGDHEANSTDTLHRSLTLLRELTFHPKLDDGPVFEREKDAVLSEMQMRNSLGYRIHKTYLEQVHADNVIPNRFPIGEADQIRKFTNEDLRTFHRQWYTSNNMVLLIVGDLRLIGENDETAEGYTLEDAQKDAERVLGVAENIFSSVPVDRVKQYNQSEGRPGMARMPSHHKYSPPSPPGGWTEASVDVTKEDSGNLISRHKRDGAAREQSFQHNQIRTFDVVLSSKSDLEPSKSHRDCFTDLVDVMVGLALDTRLNEVQKQYPEAPFIGAGWEFMNNPDYGCVMASLSIRSRPSTWRKAVLLCAAEVARLSHHGIEENELHWIKSVKQKEMKNLAKQMDSSVSDDLISTLSEDWMVDSFYTDPIQDLEIFEKLVDYVTPEVFKARAREVFRMMTDYFEPYEGQRDRLRATMFVTGPIDSDQRTLNGSGVTARQTEDSEVEGEGECDLDDEPFTMNVSDVLAALKTAVTEPSIPRAFDLPKHIIEPSLIDEAVARKNPHFVPPLLHSDSKPHGPKDVSVTEAETDTDLKGVYIDEQSGTRMWRLQNGIGVVARSSKLEPYCCRLAFSFVGGLMLENGSEEEMCVCEVGANTWLDGGAAGYKCETISKLKAVWGIDLSGRVNEESLQMTLSMDATLGGDLDKAFEMIHAQIALPNWDEEAFLRQRQHAVTAAQRMYASASGRASVLNQQVVYPGDRRFHYAPPQIVQRLELDTVKRAMARQIQPHLLQLTAVGDFDMKDLQRLSLRFLGTIEVPSPDPRAGPLNHSRDVYEKTGKLGLAPPSRFEKSSVVGEFTEESTEGVQVHITITTHGVARYAPSDPLKNGFNDYRYRVWKYVELLLNERLLT
eukprot:GHVN01000978.1.p1 GENE.GHVN01000978.1~~GHVN01000978.1.p1  ORF type:complete len:977 (+),score=126.17 GHVN01000978.1:2143-5073(+)